VLKLDAPIPDDIGKKIDTALKEMMGVKEVIIDKCFVNITYDLLEVTAEQIETNIEEAGENLAVSWGEKLKLAFIYYFEETELDNLEHQQSSHEHHHH
jgi:hypothetical protein